MAEKKIIYAPDQFIEVHAKVRVIGLAKYPITGLVYQVEFPITKDQMYSFSVPECLVYPVQENKNDSK